MEEQEKIKNHIAHLMILTSGKVVDNVSGNSKEQWKEVKDNRVRTVVNQNAEKGNTRKEIIPVQQGGNQQTNGGNKDKNSRQQIEVQGKTGNEIVPVDHGANKQVQVENKFTVLEVVDEEEVNDNQLVLVVDQPSPKSPVTGNQSVAQQKQNDSVNNAGEFNTAAPLFNPSLTGIG